MFSVSPSQATTVASRTLLCSSARSPKYAPAFSCTVSPAELKFETVTCVFREHSGNSQDTFREHSGNMQGTFRKYAGNIQGRNMYIWRTYHFTSLARPLAKALTNTGTDTLLDEQTSWTAQPPDHLADTETLTVRWPARSKRHKDRKQGLLDWTDWQK
eukprot:1196085-Prorocentrum_minimum.AAC.1